MKKKTGYGKSGQEFGTICGMNTHKMMSVALAALAADFSVDVGRIRPELHSSGFGPTICSLTQQALDDIKSMGFKYARTHDWALINANERVCDYFHIFPLMHLDATAPENYHFGPTDYLLRRTREETGFDVFYRLGTSIEHSGMKMHFNSTIPGDFDKVAETFAGTVRHYNCGWADGFEWGIKYWEIWNEPDGIENMWTPPGGLSDEDRKHGSAKRMECRDQFVKFFVTALKRLKSEFGDTIKIGGPALQYYREDWFERIFSACREAGVAPDFISWHGYSNDPTAFSQQAVAARALCDRYGFPKCELIVNEWHYFGENYTWTDMQRCSDPAVKARIWDGPDSHNGIRSACFTLATLANMQRSLLDQAYYYGCRHVGSWGFKDDMERKYKVFYALKLFGSLVKDYSDICESSSAGTVYTFAVKGADGRKALLVVDYGGTKRNIEVSVKGVAPDAKVACEVLDNAHDLVPHKAAFADGVLRLTKPDFFSAAFLVRFE